MTEKIDIVSKVIIPAISLIITAGVALKGWITSRQAKFEEREKISKHAYEMYKISGDEKLKKLSLEYGYAAITRDSFLNIHQRKALVQSKNPTRDIDDYIKCRTLLDIITSPLGFEWKKERFKKRWYYNLIFATNVILFSMGAFLIITPLILALSSKYFLPIDFLSLPLEKSIGVTAYCEVMGFLLVSLNLRSLDTLHLASSLIKRHP